MSCQKKDEIATNPSFKKTGSGIKVIPLSHVAAALEPTDSVILIKSDCQGCEYQAYQNAKPLFETIFPLFVVTEFWPMAIRKNGGDPEKFLRFFLEKNYEIYELSPTASVMNPGKHIAPGEIKFFLESIRFSPVDLVLKYNK